MSDRSTVVATGWLSKPSPLGVTRSCSCLTLCEIPYARFARGCEQYRPKHGRAPRPGPTVRHQTKFSMKATIRPRTATSAREAEGDARDHLASRRPNRGERVVEGIVRHARRRYALWIKRRLRRPAIASLRSCSSETRPNRTCTGGRARTGSTQRRRSPTATTRAARARRSTGSRSRLGAAAALPLRMRRGGHGADVQVADRRARVESRAPAQKQRFALACRDRELAAHRPKGSSAPALGHSAGRGSRAAQVVTTVVRGGSARLVG